MFTIDNRIVTILTVAGSVLTIFVSGFKLFPWQQHRTNLSPRRKTIAIQGTGVLVVMGIVDYLKPSSLQSPKQASNHKKPQNTPFQTSLVTRVPSVPTTEHTDIVSSVAWSPNKPYLASGSYDNTVKIWDVTNDSLHLHATYSWHKNKVSSVAWSPDGLYLAAGSWDNIVSIWNIQEGKRVQTYTEHQRPVNAIAWSPDGKYIASCSSRDEAQTHVWEPITGKRIYTSGSDQTANGNFHNVNAVAWSPDSKQVVMATTSNDVYLCDIQQNTFGLLYSESDGVNSIAWSPNTVKDGAYLIAGYGDYLFDDTEPLKEAKGAITLFIHDARTGKIKWELGQHKLTVLSVAWSPDGSSIASASADKTVSVWQAFPQKEDRHLFTYTGHTDHVMAVAWSPDGTRLASAGRDKKVLIWKPPLSGI